VLRYIYIYHPHKEIYQDEDFLGEIVLNLFSKNQSWCQATIDILSETAILETETEFEVVFHCAIYVYEKYKRNVAEWQFFLEEVWKCDLCKAWKFILNFVVQHASEEDKWNETLVSLKTVEYFARKFAECADEKEDYNIMCDRFIRFYPKLIERLSPYKQALITALQFMEFLPFKRMRSEEDVGFFIKLLGLFEEIWKETDDILLLCSICSCILILDNHVEAMDEDIKRYLKDAHYEFTQTRVAFQDDVSI
jgi:hypothetical protein